jgi:hypothetical protein
MEEAHMDLSDLVKAAGEVDSSTDLNSLSIEDEELDYSAQQEEIAQDPIPPSEESVPDSEEEEAEAPETPNNSEDISKAATEDIEYINVTDDTGRKKLKVDYGDREKTKQAYRLAAGFQKMRAERDKISNQHKEVAGQFEELQKFKNTLNDLYAKEGIAGVFNAVRGEGEPDWDEYVLAEAHRVGKYKNASPDERKAMDDSKELRRLKAEQEMWVKTQEDLRLRAEQEKEAAEIAKFEAMVAPAFERYRFNEIEDSAKADRMDARLWREAREEFKRLEEAGEVVTQKVVTRVLKEISDDIRSLIGTQAQKTADETVERKKKVAQTKVSGATEKAKAQNSHLDDFSANVGKLGAVAAFNKLFGR